MLEFLKILLGILLPPSKYLPTPNLINQDMSIEGRIDTVLRRHYTPNTAIGNIHILYIEGCNPDFTPNANTPNQFNDLRLVGTYVDNKFKILGKWEATTEPSKYWTTYPMNTLGAARIKFGTYTAWSTGMHHTHEALVQVKDVTVCRDLNKDYKRDGDKEDTGLFGINQHWGYDLPHDDLGRSSAGCLVGRSTEGHKEFMKIVKSDPRYLSNPNFVFTATVVPASELNL